MMWHIFVTIAQHIFLEYSCNSQVMFLKWGEGKAILIGAVGPLQSECPEPPQPILGGGGWGHAPVGNFAETQPKCCILKNCAITQL